MKRFVHRLPGPISYCQCTKLCSPATVEHVIPKMLLKRAHNFGRSSKDMHNLFSVCRTLNQDKAAKILGKDFVLDSTTGVTNGTLARSCLYMNDTYQLPVDKKLVLTWQHLDRLHVPALFEFERNEIIWKYTGVSNKYVENHI